jgi:IclR helix-turn-helix domain
VNCEHGESHFVGPAHAKPGERPVSAANGGSSANGELPRTVKRSWGSRSQAQVGARREEGPARNATPEKVILELSAAQVDRVIRSAAEGSSMSLLLSGLRDVREILAREPSQMEDNRLSRSLLAGLLMLASFPTDGSYLGNAEIARLLDMNPSTTHRYVSTLVAVGLLERDPATRRYRLV